MKCQQLLEILQGIQVCFIYFLIIKALEQHKFFLNQGSSYCCEIMPYKNGCIILIHYDNLHLRFIIEGKCLLLTMYLGQYTVSGCLPCILKFFVNRINCVCSIKKRILIYNIVDILRHRTNVTSKRYRNRLQELFPYQLNPILPVRP